MPPTWPIRQSFGSGFGQLASTTKLGAVAPAGAREAPARLAELVDGAGCAERRCGCAFRGGRRIARRLAARGDAKGEPEQSESRREASFDMANPQPHPGSDHGSTALGRRAHAARQAA